MEVILIVWFLMTSGESLVSPALPQENMEVCQKKAENIAAYYKDQPDIKASGAKCFVVYSVKTKESKDGQGN